MSDTKLGAVCAHGSLQRQCDVCELTAALAERDQRIAVLDGVVVRLEREAASVMAPGTPLGKVKAETERPLRERIAALEQQRVVADRERNDALAASLMDMNACLKAEAEVARLTGELTLDRAVCICGCSPDVHEVDPIDGESCGDDSHECLRVAPGVAEMFARAQHEVERLTGERDEWRGKAEVSEESAKASAECALQISTEKEQAEARADQLAKALTEEKRLHDATEDRRVRTFAALTRTEQALAERQPEGGALLRDAVRLARDVVETEQHYAIVGCPGVESELLAAALRILKANSDG